MKIFAIFDSMPKPDAAITGGHQCLPAKGGVILVCAPKNGYARCEEHLAALGGKVFPHPLSGDGIGAIANHPAFAGAGLQASHNSFKAALLLAQHFGWPALDPRD